MNAVIEKELKNYRKQIKKVLTVPSNEKAKMLQGLQSGIEEFAEQHPDAPFEDIQSHFGKPEEVAAEYLPDITPKDMKQFTRRKKIILGLIVGLVVLVGIFIAIYFGLVEKTPGIIKETEKFEEPISEAVIVENY